MTPSQWSFGIAPTKKAAIGTRWFSVFETTETKITFGAELQFFPWFHFSPHVYPQGWRMILMTHSRSLWSLIYISLNNKSILPCSLYAGSNVAVILPASSHPLGNQRFFSFSLISFSYSRLSSIYPQVLHVIFVTRSPKSAETKTKNSIRTFQFLTYKKNFWVTLQNTWPLISIFLNSNCLLCYP